MSCDYSEKLKDPRWQRLRLKKMEASNWSCQCCDNKEKTLHIHHKIYKKCEPWEYELHELECLCEDCHDWREGFNEMFGRSLFSTYNCSLFVSWSSRAFGSKIPQSYFRSIVLISDIGEMINNKMEQDRKFEGGLGI